MSQRSSTLFTLFFLPILAFAILAIAYAVISLLSVPQRAVEKFGPPSATLSERNIYVLSARLLWQKDRLLKAANPDGAPVSFNIELGEPTSSVIQRLENQNLIQDDGAFRLYLQYSGLDTSLQAGDYVLSPAMTSLEIAQALQDPTPGQVDFTILPGWRTEEIAAALSYTGLQISAEAFISAAQLTPTGYSFAEDIPSTATAEGFFFPGAYELSRESRAPELIAIFLGRFEIEVTPEIRQAISDQGLTLLEGVTLASIIERETVVESEMPTIASVYYNRLRAGTKLDADPTVQYAVGFNISQNTWWTNPLSMEDLQFESLYNTYIYPGLPPGPIANPGLAALEAVASPADSPYYYFRARCDGSGLHAFAVTFDEQVKNACK